MPIPILQMHKKQDKYGNKKTTIIYKKNGKVFHDDASLTNIELECISRHGNDRTSIQSLPKTYYEEEKWTKPFICKSGYFLTSFSLQVHAYKVRYTCNLYFSRVQEITWWRIFQIIREHFTRKILICYFSFFENKIKLKWTYYYLLFRERERTRTIPQQTSSNLNAASFLVKRESIS